MTDAPMPIFRADTVTLARAFEMQKFGTFLVYVDHIEFWYRKKLFVADRNPVVSMYVFKLPVGNTLIPLRADDSRGPYYVELSRWDRARLLVALENSELRPTVIKAGLWLNYSKPDKIARKCGGAK